MTTIEKIKAEIERQIKDPQEYCYGVSSINKLRELLDFLSTLEEPVSEELDEAADEYAKDTIPMTDEEYIDGGKRDAFIAGAKWQKEQMMKEAVEGKVFMSFAPGHNQMVMADVDLPTNTKVRIIIVKED